MQFHCGIRNVAVFTIETRTKLGFSYKTLAKYLGVSPIVIFWVENGEIPPKWVLERLILLNKLSPLLLTYFQVIEGLIHTTVRFLNYIKKQFFYFELKLKGGILKDGQLILPCCYGLVAK